MAAQHEDWLFVGVYADIVSGTKKEKRPQLQRLLADCAAGRVTLNKNALTGPDTYAASAANWVGTVSGLPLYKKISGGTYYTYYYTIDEITVNGEAVTGKQTSGTTTTGYTDDYSVTINQDGRTITNKEREKIEVNASKVWSNADGSATAPEGGTVTFELFADDEATGKRVVLDGTTMEQEIAAINADPEKSAEEKAAEIAALQALSYGEYTAWKAEWKNLPKYQPDGTTEISYTVKEVEGYSGYRIDQDSSNGAASGGTITNIQITAEVDLLKTDESGTPLAGATFKLQKYKDGTYQETDGAAVEKSVAADGDNKGKLSFENLTVGYYELEETVTPDGYIRTSENPKFEIIIDPTDSTKLKVVFTNTDIVTYDADANLFTVKNTPGEPLPSAGGPGTVLITVLGLMLAFGAGGAIMMRRRMKQ